MNEKGTPKDSEVAAMVTANEALEARTAAQQIESRLRKEPLWRFLRRRKLGQELAVARKVEYSAIAVMGGKPIRRG